MLQKKICILGPTGVGKTSLVKQFVDGIFSEKYLTSIGVKIDKKLVSTSFTPVQMLIWDLEGIDKYCGFNPKYLRGCAALIIVVDQTRFSSLGEAMEIFSLCRKETDVPVVLAINKTDLSPSMNWDNKILQKHVDKFNDVRYTSAKTGQNVENMFESLARLVSIAQ
jgi:small GTP-binding protein